MTIDHETEALLAFSEACACFGRKRVSIQTLHRWRLHGVRGVKLDTIVIGGQRFTSRQAISRFIGSQNADQPATVAVAPAQRARQSQAARDALAAAGI